MEAEFLQALLATDGWWEPYPSSEVRRVADYTVQAVNFALI